MPERSKEGAGLRGQVAGATSLCTVGVAGSGLSYRGHEIDELARKASFEEVAWLLLQGDLPTRRELEGFTGKLKRLRGLPAELREVLERIPANAHPMDVMRTACSMLGNLEPEQDFSQQDAVSDRLLAVLPSVICYWYAWSHFGRRIETELDSDSIGGHFLHMLRGEEADVLSRQVMNVSLILYAEHEFNASTFTARVVASTLSDMHSCIVAAIGALRGPLHGGANEAAMAMIERWQSPSEAESAILAMLARKEKIMGFGHAVYRKSDPRTPIIKDLAKQLARQVGDSVLYPVSLRCEEVMWREKRLFANADFFHASAYHFMGIPTKLFTPIFVMSRLTGWAAHVKEQRANNRIIRPSAEYTGPAGAEWVDIDKR